MAYDTTCSPQTAPTDDAWKINSEVHGKHAITMTPGQCKIEDLTKSTSVVAAEYPLKVKSEILTTLSAKEG